MSFHGEQTSTLPRDLPRHLLRRADHMVMAAPNYYTADMVRALPDDRNRYETVLPPA